MLGKALAGAKGKPAGWYGTVRYVLMIQFSGLWHYTKSTKSSFEANIE
jgi:hypothetical protein